MMAGGIVENNTENLLRWVKDPNEVKPGNRMAQLAGAYQDPENPITDEEAQALVAYLQSLKPDLEAPSATPTPSPAATPTPPDGAPTPMPTPTLTGPPPPVRLEIESWRTRTSSTRTPW